MNRMLRETRVNQYMGIDTYVCSGIREVYEPHSNANEERRT